MAEPAHRLEDSATVETGAPFSADAAIHAATAEVEAARPSLDLESQIGKGKLDIATAFQLIAKNHGRTYNQILIEIAKLSFGPGKLKVDEYLDLGLYDDASLASDKRSFVGLDVMRDIWMTVNYNNHWNGLLEHKLAATTLLAGFGFPTIPTRALYSQDYELPGVATFKTPNDLASFLRDESQYPLFGKPADAFQSIGSASLASYDKTTDSIVMLHGQSVRVDDFATEVAEAYSGGYILQGRLDPHPAIQSVCGTRLATCRIVTIRGEQGVEVTRSLWKIPAGRNVADNFWRSGNMLGQLDAETGTVIRVQRGTGLAATAPETHPDTGAQILGFTIPHFDHAKTLAINAHKVFKDVNLIGWDIAITGEGPVIVEPNITPDFFLPQVVDRRGMLDDKLKALIESCKAAKAAQAKLDSKQYRAEMRARRHRITAAALEG